MDSIKSTAMNLDPYFEEIQSVKVVRQMVAIWILLSFEPKKMFALHMTVKMEAQQL